MTLPLPRAKGGCEHDVLYCSASAEKQFGGESKAIIGGGGGDDDGRLEYSAFGEGVFHASGHAMSGQCNGGRRRSAEGNRKKDVGGQNSFGILTLSLARSLACSRSCGGQGLTGLVLESNPTRSAVALCIGFRL